MWHQFVAHWQDSHFKNSLQDLKQGEILSLIDFAENYSYKGQSEIQSQHWFSFQCTILVHITYQVNESHNPSDPKSKRLRTEYHYYISDDRVHDSLFCPTLSCIALEVLGCCRKYSQTAYRLERRLCLTIQGSQGVVFCGEVSLSLYTVAFTVFSILCALYAFC